ncbi:MAG: 3-keto-disaccharide hydrolase [Bryobacteraceae bacterium]
MNRFLPAAIVAVLIPCSGSPAEEPQPRVAVPGNAGQPPSDAVVLFNGKDLSAWVYRDGRPAGWPIVDGALVCKSGTGNILSKRKMRSAQIHVEFATPYMPEAKSQARGNSGVYLQGRYEIQILDSYRNPTYANGSCGALYGQYAPLVNVCRKPGEWQTYDIVFHAPQCDGSGKLSKPGTVTVLQNGVLVQDRVTIQGITRSGNEDNICDEGSLMLQDHFHPDVKETFMQFGTSGIDRWPKRRNKIHEWLAVGRASP